MTAFDQGFALLKKPLLPESFRDEGDGGYTADFLDPDTQDIYPLTGEKHADIAEVYADLPEGKEDLRDREHFSEKRGRQVGFSVSDDRGPSTFIEPDYQFMGIGTALYDFLTMMGLRPRPSEAQSDAAEHFWAKNQGQSLEEYLDRSKPELTDWRSLEEREGRE